MHITNLELHMNYLFSAALNYPKEIKDIRPWLSTVLNHKYYDMLRKKYKWPTFPANTEKLLYGTI